MYLNNWWGGGGGDESPAELRIDNIIKNIQTSESITTATLSVSHIFSFFVMIFFRLRLGFSNSSFTGRSSLVETFLDGHLGERSSGPSGAIPERFVLIEHREGGASVYVRTESFR